MSLAALVIGRGISRFKTAVRAACAWLALAGAFLAWHSPACLGAQDPVITEFMAANYTGEKDEDGDYSDWIEIYNPNTQAVSLSGWYLSNNPQNLTAWRFPEATVPGQGFLIVFASGKDRTNPKARLHTNFKLNSDGEYLALVKPDGAAIVSEYFYPRQTGDVSYGKSIIATTQKLVPSTAAGRMLIPTDNRSDTAWMKPDFGDATWSSIAMGIGYDRTTGGIDPAEPPVLEGDVTLPGDVISPTSSNSPGNEGVANAIDNNPSTKYLNFDKLNAGLTVTPSIGKSVVTGLRLTSANDAPERDPVTFLISGSNDGYNFTQIAVGNIPSFTGRFTPVAVTFTNETAYSHYKLIFPSVQNAAAAVAVQIAEVEFLGRSGPPPQTYSSLIASSVDGLLFGRAASVCLRFPFVFSSAQAFDLLSLQARYDDGFAAYLNGAEIIRANTPNVLAYNSMAVTNRYRNNAVYEESFNLAAFAGLLREGTNVLAIQALRCRADCPSFLFQAQLAGTQIKMSESGYFPSPSPGRLNDAACEGLIEALVFDQPRGFYDNPINAAIYSPTAGATIYYTTNGSAPSATNGMAYAGPIRISGTTTLRAAAFRSGWIPSPIATHTYIFLNDVILQNRASTLAAGFPNSWGSRAADYGLDPRVAGANGTDKYGGKYARTIKDDLKSLPSLSIVMNRDDMFGTNGIYSNPTSRGSAWEKPASLEWIYPDNRAGFQAYAGLRIQGGAFRQFNLSLKKSFQVVFKSKYGAKALRYPVFGEHAAAEFNKFILRANSNDAWPYDGASAIYVRNSFANATALDMGMIASHDNFVHLYINGQYWGLYNPVERPDAAFSATYHGGDKSTWDAINQDSAPDGNYDAWTRMITLLNKGMADNTNYQRIQGNNPDGTRNPAYEDLLDVDNLIDYMILNIYAGNTDWPGRNWWAGRDRNNGDGFHFYPWDTETALGVTGLNANVTGVADAVARPYAALRANADFRIRFADHVFRHFLNGGALYVNPASTKWDPLHPENNRPAARFAALADSINRAIVGESARWGDQLVTNPFTRDEHWLKERDNLLLNFFPKRSAIVLEQLRQAGLYPRTEAPVMNQQGGVVPVGFKLAMTAPLGIIYYTTNGADPRLLPANSPDLLRYSGPAALEGIATIKTRALNGEEWSALNEVTFTVGKPALKITELNYNPAAPSAAESAAGFTNASDFEFIELFNSGTGPQDLNGALFIDGIEFSFTNSAISTLAPGQYALIVKNKASFEARYGLGLPVAGEFSGQLNNGGERIAIASRSGDVLAEMTYDSIAPWPAAPDGGGSTLEILDAAGDANNPENWHPSEQPGGTPGKANSSPALQLLSPKSQGSRLHFQFNPIGSRGYTLHTRQSLTDGEWQAYTGGTAITQDQHIEIAVDILPEPRYFMISQP